MNLNVPTSVGDAFDRLSILQVKMEMLCNTPGVAHVEREMEAVLDALHRAGLASVLTNDHFALLLEINRHLWNIEEGVRAALRANDNDRWAFWAKQVPVYNDKRAKVKRQINIEYDSDIVEVKSHEGAQ